MFIIIIGIWKQYQYHCLCETVYQCIRYFSYSIRITTNLLLLKHTEKLMGTKVDNPNVQGTAINSGKWLLYYYIKNSSLTLSTRRMRSTTSVKSPQERSTLINRSTLKTV